MDSKGMTIFTRIKAIFLNVCLFIIYITIMGLVLSVSSKFALFLSITILIFCIFFLIKPTIFKLPNWWTRATVFGISVYTAVFISIANVGYIDEVKESNQKELFELKIKDPRKYLSELKASPDSHSLYLQEFKSMYPNEYQLEMEQISKLKAEASAKEYQELKIKLENIKKLSEQQKLDLYSQLLKHDPNNKIFKREYTKYLELANEAKLKEIAKQVDIENKDKARSNPTNFLELVDFQWSKQGFGTVMEATFVIKNKSPIDIKDISIVCKSAAASGTIIDKNSRIIYEIIKAKSKKTFKNVNMGFINSQVVSSSCYIKHAVAM